MNEREIALPMRRMTTLQIISSQGTRRRYRLQHIDGRVEMQPGTVLQNGRTVIEHDLERGVVLAFKEGAHHPYATWIVDRYYGNTVSGNYFSTLEEGLADFRKRG